MNLQTLTSLNPSVQTISALAKQKELTSSNFFDAVCYIKGEKPKVILDLTSMKSLKQLAGVVNRTARFTPIGDRKPKDATFMKDVPPGGIVAVEIEPYSGANTPVGSIVEQSLYQQGVTGIVLNGRLRDKESIPQERAIWASGTTCCGAYGDLWEEEVDCPIHICGIRVALGSLIVADESGIVVSPALSYAELTIVSKFVDADNYAKFLVQCSGLNSNTAKDMALEHFGLS